MSWSFTVQKRLHLFNFFRTLHFFLQVFPFLASWTSGCKGGQGCMFWLQIRAHSDNRHDSYQYQLFSQTSALPYFSQQQQLSLMQENRTHIVLEVTPLTTVLFFLLFYFPKLLSQLPETVTPPAVTMQGQRSEVKSIQTTLASSALNPTKSPSLAIK